MKLKLILTFDNVTKERVEDVQGFIDDGDLTAVYEILDIDVPDKIEMVGE